MEKISIIGAGVMGHSIALQAALAGYETMIVGINATELLACVQKIRQGAAMLLDEHVITGEQVETALSKISTDVVIDRAVRGARFVIECVPENLDVKQKVFSALEKACPADTILASTTSSFTPQALFNHLHHCERTMVSHFWNPAYLVPLVEVVRSDETSDAAFAQTMELLKRMNKHVVVLKRPICGFIGNRLQLALFREAEHILSSGVATMQDIDDVVTYGFGRRLSVTGPFLSADFTGLDVMTSLCQELYPGLSDQKNPSEDLAARLRQNHLGAKTGRGFYDDNGDMYTKMHKRRITNLVRHMHDHDINSNETEKS